MGSVLNDFRVLVTRPEPAGRELCAIIEQHGGSAFYFPTIQFAPPNDRDAYLQTLRQLSDYDMLIFISPQAANATQHDLQKVWPTLTDKPKIAAVGEGTKKVLLEMGLTVDYVPTSNWGSDSLLAMPALTEVKGQHILLVRGEEGREMLAEKLTERGAIVNHLIAYQRVMPPASNLPLLSLMKKKKIHVIVCTSFTGVQNLKTMITEEGWNDLQAIPLIVVSSRIKMLAHELGFTEINLAENASHDSILKTLIQIRNESCQKN